MSLSLAFNSFFPALMIDASFELNKTLIPSMKTMVVVIFPNFQNSLKFSNLSPGVLYFEAA